MHIGTNLRTCARQSSLLRHNPIVVQVYMSNSSQICSDASQMNCRFSMFMLQKSKRPVVRFSEPYRRDRSTHLQHLAKAKVGEKDETSPVSRHASKCSQDILEDAAAIVPSTVAESSQIRPSLQLCAAVLKAR